GALVGIGEDVVAAAGADDDGGAVRVFRRIDREGGDADVREDLDLVVAFQFDGLVGQLQAGFAGHAPGPEGDGIERGGDGGEHGEQGEGGEQGFHDGGA